MASNPSSRYGGLCALVTGGGTGIGRSIALGLARQGCKVAISGRRRAPLDQTAAEITAASKTDGQSLVVEGDIATAQGCTEMVDQAASELRGLHILVNNAGIARAMPIDSFTESDIDALIDIDLKGPLHTIRAALPHLRQHREERTASILNISSNVTLTAIPNYSVYAAAKSGLDSLTRSLALELSSDRIRVNAILPGVVATPIFETMMSPEDAEGFLAGFGDQVPLGRVGTPEDIARMAVTLCDPVNDWVTGVVMPVDGGLSLGPG